MGIESYCVSCEENGKTNVLMTRIPFFREVIVMSFLCQHCGFRSSEVQAAGTQPKGCKFELVVATPKVCHAWAAPHWRAVVSTVGSNFKLGTPGQLVERGQLFKRRTGPSGSCVCVNLVITVYCCRCR